MSARNILQARSLLIPVGTSRDGRDAQEPVGVVLSRPAKIEVGTLGTKDRILSNVPTCPDLVPTPVGTLEAAESLDVPSVPSCPDQKQHEARQSDDLNREPWADDPAEWCNWAPEAAPRFDPDAELRIIVEDLLAERLRLKQVAAAMHITPEAVRRLMAGGKL